MQSTSQLVGRKEYSRDGRGTSTDRARLRDMVSRPVPRLPLITIALEVLTGLFIILRIAHTRARELSPQRDRAFCRVTVLKLHPRGKTSACKQRFLILNATR